MYALLLQLFTRYFSLVCPLVISQHLIYKKFYFSTILFTIHIQSVSFSSLNSIQFFSLSSPYFSTLVICRNSTLRPLLYTKYTLNVCFSTTTRNSILFFILPSPYFLILDIFWSSTLRLLLCTSILLSLLKPRYIWHSTLLLFLYTRCTSNIFTSTLTLNSIPSSFSSLPTSQLSKCFDILLFDFFNALNKLRMYVLHSKFNSIFSSVCPIDYCQHLIYLTFYFWTISVH